MIWWDFCSERCSEAFMAAVPPMGRDAPDLVGLWEVAILCAEVGLERAPSLG